MQSAQKYGELFAKFAGSDSELMSPGKAHAVLLKSKLPKLVLAQIWKLSDVDKYVLVTHLCRPCLSKL